MLYSIMYRNGLSRVGVRAIRETRESAEEDSKNLYWVSVVEDDDGIGARLESGYNGEAEQHLDTYTRK